MNASLANVMDGEQRAANNDGNSIDAPSESTKIGGRRKGTGHSQGRADDQPRGRDDS
jgi:hypothetical protein